MSVISGRRGPSDGEQNGDSNRMSTGNTVQTETEATFKSESTQSDDTEREFAKSRHFEGEGEST